MFFFCTDNYVKNFDFLLQIKLRLYSVSLNNVPTQKRNKTDFFTQFCIIRFPLNRVSFFLLGPLKGCQFSILFPLDRIMVHTAIQE